MSSTAPESTFAGVISASYSPEQAYGLFLVARAAMGERMLDSHDFGQAEFMVTWVNSVKFGPLAEWELDLQAGFIDIVDLS